MPVVSQALFTGTAGVNVATGYTPDVGGAFTQHASSQTTVLLTDANRARPETAGSTQRAILYGPDPGADDYEVGCDAVRLTAAEGVIGVAARIDTAADTRYYVAQNNTTGVAELGKVVAGTTTVIQSIASTVTRTLRLRVGVSSQRWWVDGVEQTPGADTAITARGRPGLHGVTGADAPPGNAVSVHWDNYYVDNLLAGVGGYLYMVPIQLRYR